VIPPIKHRVPPTPTMPTLQAISDTLVQESIIRAVKAVCTAMLKQDAGFVEKSPHTAYDGFKEKPHVFGSVGFVGKIDGIVYLCIPDDFAREAASRVLGMSAAEVAMSGDEVIKDVIGEITNMAVGGFKTPSATSVFPAS